jgi:hypothetical protein
MIDKTSLITPHFFNITYLRHLPVFLQTIQHFVQCSVQAVQGSTSVHFRVSSYIYLYIYIYDVDMLCKQVFSNYTDIPDLIFSAVGCYKLN